MKTLKTLDMEALKEKMPEIHKELARRRGAKQGEQ